MLVTLLVLWLIVIPVLTLAGAYARAGVLGRGSRARAEKAADLASGPVLATTPVRVATGRDG